MTTTWGAPVPDQPRWGWRETVVAVGVAAVIAGVGGAAIHAASDGAAFHPGGPGFGGPPGAVGGPPAATSAPGLHGEFVTGDAATGFVTALSQTGTVTAASPTSITIRSADGFTQTYTLPANHPPVAVNDEVQVRGTRTGDTAQASSVSVERR